MSCGYVVARIAELSPELQAAIKEWQELVKKVWWYCDITIDQDYNVCITGDGLTILKLRTSVDPNMLEVLISGRHFPAIRYGHWVTLDEITSYVMVMATNNSKERFATITG